MSKGPFQVVGFREWMGFVPVVSGLLMQGIAVDGRVWVLSVCWWSC